MYILVYTSIYFVTVSRIQLLLFHLIRTALRRIVLMLPWRTVGMHVPNSFSSAICVQSMDSCRGTVLVHTKQDQVYTSKYVYILVSTTSMYLTISYQMICCANSSLAVWVVCQLRPLKKGGMLTWLKATSVVLRPVGGARLIERNSK